MAGRIIRGLPNIGSTCYFNALVQLLCDMKLELPTAAAQGQGLGADTTTTTDKEKEKEKSRARAIALLAECLTLLLRNRQGRVNHPQFAVSPELMHQLVTAVGLRVGEANDPDDVMYALFDRLGIGSLFGFKLDIECTECAFTTQYQECSHRLLHTLTAAQASGGAQVSLADIIIASIRPDISRVCATDAKHVMRVVRVTLPPKHLLLHLQRTACGSLSYDGPQCRVFVKFDEVVKINGTQMRLRGFIVDAGGHYFYVGRFQGQWYIFDDATVRHVPTQDVLRLFRGSVRLMCYEHMQ